MPLDSRIILSGVVPQIKSAAEARFDKLKEQQLQQQTQLGAIGLQEKQRAADDQEAIRQALVQSGGDLEKALPSVMQVSPTAGLSLAKEIDNQRKAKADAEKTSIDTQLAHMKFLSQTLQGANEQNYPLVYKMATAALGSSDGLPPTYDKQAIDAIVSAGQTAQERLMAARDAMQAKVDEAELPGKVADSAIKQAEAAHMDQATGQTPAQQESAKPASAKEYEYAVKHAGYKGTYEQYQNEDANRRRSIVNVNAPEAISDVKETVQGMKDGTLPPQLPGRATKEYLALMAEAHRQGFDLAGAATDWSATQKHIATLNGTQQTRLMQSINQLPELLDSVDELAAKWKGGRFPILNRGNLALAKNGVYGPEVASLANQLSTQIADVTADLGAVYMGGNSPTDEALRLAKTSLSADWDSSVLKNMTDLARKNVQIRKNSIANTGVQGVGPNNPYAPPAPSLQAPSGGSKFKILSVQ